MQKLRLLEIGPTPYSGATCLLLLSAGTVQMFGDAHLVDNPVAVLSQFATGFHISILKKNQKAKIDQDPDAMQVRLSRRGSLGAVLVLKPEVMAKLEIRWSNAYFDCHEGPRGIYVSGIPVLEQDRDPKTGRFRYPLASISEHSPAIISKAEKIF